MRLTWLADVLRAAGLTVVEVDGWKTRGVAYTTDPLAVICHETQGSATSSVQGELNVLINGRTGLPGPIAQLMIDRKGVWYVVASGRCNQVKTGWGGPLSGKGNSYSFGIEAMHAVSENWTTKPAQYASYVRGVAAICGRMKWQPDDHVIGHKEHQPGDKSDPEFSMPAFRAAVAGEDGDDMQITDKIPYVKGPEASYSQDSTTAATMWGQTLYYVLALRNKVAANDAADKARDEALLAAITALTGGGGSVDSAVIVNAVNAVRDQVLAKIEAEVSELRTENDLLNARLADALTGQD